jgi:hypothetical protein
MASRQSSEPKQPQPSTRSVVNVNVVGIINEDVVGIINEDVVGIIDDDVVYR